MVVFPAIVAANRQHLVVIRAAELVWGKLSAGIIDTEYSSPAQQLRQLGEVRRHATGLVPTRTRPPTEAASLFFDRVQ